MNTILSEKIHKINYLATQLNAAYHQAALKLGMSDSVMCVLYAIYDNGESCLLSEIYKQSGISKQTVNSAVRKLERDGMIYLEQFKGKARTICLTDKGKSFTNNTIARLCEAETGVLDAWPADEIESYISLLEKYVSDLKLQIERMYD